MPLPMGDSLHRLHSVRLAMRQDRVVPEIEGELSAVATEKPGNSGARRHPRSRTAARGIRIRLTRVVAVALAIVVLSTFDLVVATSASATTAFVDLGTLGGSDSDAIALSPSGEVVGYSQTSAGNDHAFAWTTAGGMTDLGTLGGRASYPVGVTADGEVVGNSQTSAGNNHAFAWTASGGITDLGTLGGATSNPVAVSSHGQVVGSSETASGAVHAFSWTAAGGMVDLGTLGGNYSAAAGVNNVGQVVGYSYTTTAATDGEQHAFIWTPAGGMVDLGTLAGDYSSSAAAINNNGQVVGYSDSTANTGSGGSLRAFSWTASGGMVYLGTLGGESDPVAVNDDGQVVGVSDVPPGGNHAFSWTPSSGMVDLGTLGGVTSGVGGSASVSSNGQVVGGSATPSQGVNHAFSWTQAEGLLDLGTAGGVTSYAVAVNDSGQVVGDANFGGGAGDDHAVLWQGTPGQTIVFTAIAPANAMVGGPTYIVGATGGASGNTVTFAIDASSSSGCSISGETISFSPPAGTCVVDANQLGNANYEPAALAQQSFVVTGAISVHPTTTALAAAPGAAPGAANGFTVAVTDGNANPVCAGTVSLFDNGSPTPLNTVPLSGSGSLCVFSFTNTFTVGGAHSVVAVFTPADPAAYAASQSAPVTFTQTGPAEACPDGGTGCTDHQTVQANVAAGTITITTPYTPTHPLDLGVLQLDSSGTVLSAVATVGSSSDPAGAIGITDTRAGNTNWTASVQASDLIDPANGAINGQNMGLTDLTAMPIAGNALTASNIALTDIPALAQPVAANNTGSLGLGGEPHAIAASTTGGDGTIGIYGTLTLKAPTSTAAGTYTGTLTFTIG